MRREDIELPAVIGKFTGECADATITNENGLDITRPVWENVFNSEEFKQGIDLGWYIGFLGHPDDPGNQDFRNACIVMKSGRIDDDGKVYGEFDLISTPVGRVVKTFIDAGVTFGISVRGAGDIINNSVDPDTFVFRGFDLVSFPAYPNAIPEFQAIAASTDAASRAKYQKICASIEAELSEITSPDALDVIQDQFPEQSETAQSIIDRKAELEEAQVEESLLEEQVNGLTDLYLKTKDRADQAETTIKMLTQEHEREQLLASRKLAVIQRICAAQKNDVEHITESTRSHEQVLVRANKRIKDRLDAEKQTVEATKNTVSKLQADIKASKKMVHELQNKLDEEQQSNLQYRTKIEASEQLLADKDVQLQQLQDELDKTVVQASRAAEKASNRDEEFEHLNEQYVQATKLLEEYQDAYANLYAQAVGVNLNNVTVYASTSVPELQKLITGSSSSWNTSDVLVEPQFVDVDDGDDEVVTI